MFMVRKGDATFLRYESQNCGNGVFLATGAANKEQG